MQLVREFLKLLRWSSDDVFTFELLLLWNFAGFGGLRALEVLHICWLRSMLGDCCQVLLYVTDKGVGFARFYGILGKRKVNSWLLIPFFLRCWHLKNVLLSFASFAFASRWFFLAKSFAIFYFIDFFIVLTFSTFVGFITKAVDSFIFSFLFSFFILFFLLFDQFI